MGVGGNRWGMGTTELIFYEDKELRTESKFEMEEVSSFHSPI